MKIDIFYFAILLFVGFIPFNIQAQCPDSEEALDWGYGAISQFYANEYLQQDRNQLGVSKDDLSLDEIIPVTDSMVCSQLENHIMASSEYDDSTKNQSKVYFKNEATGRYFFIAYTDPAQIGWSTGVYILDQNYDKLGGFGV